MEIAHKRRVVRRDDVLERRDAVCGGVTDLVNIHFDGHRNTVQRTGLGATGHLGIQRLGLDEGCIAQIFDYGVQCGVHSTHPGHCIGGHFCRAQFAGLQFR